MRKLHDYLLILFITGLTSCVYDADPVVNPPEEDKEVSVDVRVNTSSAIYSAADELENKITTIDLLAFKVTGGYNKYEYRVKVEEHQISDGNTASEKKFNVRLIKNDSRYHYVLIANARDAVDAIEPISKMMPKEEIIPQIVMDKESWHLDGNPPDRIPMWSETKDPVELIEGQDLKGLYLLRTLARIDVIVKPNVSNFILREVYLYNRYTNGRLSPDPINWDLDNLRVKSPTMPAAPVKVLGPVAYKSDTGFPDNSLIETIYTFEAVKTSQGEDLITTCLVIGGLYNTQDPDDISYYRIDFTGLKRDDEDDDDDDDGPPGSGGGGGGGVGTKGHYRPLLRNYIHELRINSVSKRGEDTPDDAFRKKNEVMDFEVETWDMNNISSEIGGIYRLRISTNILEVKESAPGYITIDSDNPEPWRAETSQSWITTEKTGPRTLKVTVTGTTPETGKIEIIVGNITKAITINRIS